MKGDGPKRLGVYFKARKDCEVSDEKLIVFALQRNSRRDAGSVPGQEAGSVF